jgi:hypothetical protein
LAVIVRAFHIFSPKRLTATPQLGTIAVMHSTDDKTPIAYDRHGKPIFFGDEVVVLKWPKPQKVGAVKMWPDSTCLYSEEGWALGRNDEVEVVEEPPFDKWLQPGDKVNVVDDHRSGPWPGPWRVIAWVPEGPGKYVIVNHWGSLRSLHPYDRDRIRVVERAS